MPSEDPRRRAGARRRATRRTPANRGSTNATITTTATIATTTTTQRVREGGPDLLPGILVPLDVGRELVEHLVDVAGDLGRPQDGRCRTSGTLRGCTRDRVGERHAGAQRLRHLGEDLAEPVVLRLVPQDVDGVDERDAGTHERRELAREVHDLARAATFLVMSSILMKPGASCDLDARTGPGPRAAARASFEVVGLDGPSDRLPVSR